MKKVIYATIRESETQYGEPCNDIECRFDNGEKYTGIEIPLDFEQAEDISQLIVNYINNQDKKWLKYLKTTYKN